MNILILTAYFPPEITGAGHLYFELAEGLAKKGHQVTVVTCIPRWHINEVDKKYRGKIFMREEIKGVEIIRVRIPPLPLKSIPASRGIDHFLVALEFVLGGLVSGRQDAILVYSPPLPLGLTARILKKVKDAAFIFNVQDIFPKYAIDSGVLKNQFLIKGFEKIESYVYKNANFITVHSPGNKRYLASCGIPQNKLVVIPNWVDTSRVTPGIKHNSFREEHNLGDEFIVSYAGTIGYAQDMEVIIDCAAHLKSYEDLLFLLVGEGPKKGEIQNRANERNLDNVKFLPIQPWDKYPSVLQASDVCLVNLNNLSTPVVPSKIFNIMASGRPIAASMPLEGDAPKIIDKAGCGICVECGDAEELSEAILELYQKPSLREKMGRNGRKAAKELYSREVCTDKYEELLKRL